ncbi:Lipase (class 3) [Nakaseomyces glabratus]
MLGRQVTMLLKVIVAVAVLFVWHRSRDSSRGDGSNGDGLSDSSGNGFRLEHIWAYDPEDVVSSCVDVSEEMRVSADEYVSMESGSEFVESWWAKTGARPFGHVFDLRSRSMDIQRLQDRDPVSMEKYIDFSLENPELARTIELEWVTAKIQVPDVRNRNTVLALALMSSNAYVRTPYTGDWRNLSSSWGHTGEEKFGWDKDGLRGHIFVNKITKVVVIAIKGTSSQGLFGSGEEDTITNDKINDNLLFSCCCARISYLWTTVCDCYMKSYTCDENCVEAELKRKDRYYAATLKLYKQVTEMYPDSAIWLTGHSLGGALAALLGRTYGVPAVTFEAPGELLPAKRLHLPLPPGLPDYEEAIWHFGHNADPIFMGTCNGASSSCSIGGYAMETACHSGQYCMYDVVNDKGWRVNLLNHRIHRVIDEVILEYGRPAKCQRAPTCIDCYNWKFVNKRRNRREESSSSIASSSQLTSSHSESETLTSTDAPEKTCIGRNWLGICTDYGV